MDLDLNCVQWKGEGKSTNKPPWT